MYRATATVAPTVAKPAHACNISGGMQVGANRVSRAAKPGVAALIERRPEIDYLKGLAIVFVFFIHAEPLGGSWIHDYVINRAVPVFLVIFGLNARMWWESRSSLGFWRRSGEWYNGRLRRLVPPVWTVLTIWWLCSPWVPGYPTASLGRLVANYLGYTPWLGTFWFVTLIFQLVILYPILQGALDRLGAPLCLSLAALAAVWSHLHTLEITEWMRALLRDTAPGRGLYLFYYFWIFPLQYFWLVFAGMALARWEVNRVSALVAALATFLASAMLQSAVGAQFPLVRNAIQRLADVPLAYGALAGFSLLGQPALATRWLSWCGRHSWGLYLAQMLIHDVAGRLRLDFDYLPLPRPWEYLLWLLAASVAIVSAANALLGAGHKLLAAGHALGPRAAAAGSARPKRGNRR